jgi:pyruvate,orthophosphate dikinase
MFGNVVLGIEPLRFEKALAALKAAAGCETDRDVDAAGWERLVGEYQTVIWKHAGRPFPQALNEQLELAVDAVFRSWMNQRAIVYRKVHRIPDEQGTAVNVQAMVFGNRGADSGTGVLFTRNPSTGENALFGEFLFDAQGEDVVAGVRTPLPLHALETEMPALFAELKAVAKRLERHYGDMQDIEFTVEQGRLYLLQTRAGKRSAQAAMRIAVELVREGTLSREEALLRVDPMHLNQLLHRALDERAAKEVIARGLPASPGAAVGRVVFDADMAEEWAKSGHKVILVTSETTPEDIHGVLAAEGTLTSRGGMTSHAAVVARGMGKPCVCGCVALRIEPERKQFAADGGRIVNEGDWITVDGASGQVLIGAVPLREAELSAELLQMLSWADDVRGLRVLANADTPEDARKARELGAEGIGLCRTEHMFLSPDRLPVVQRMIVAEGESERANVLCDLLPMQQLDFEGLFRAMDGLPVTIRLLDPPLHEFLPSLDELHKQRRQLLDAGGRTADRDTGIAAEPGADRDASALERELEAVERTIRKVRSLQEANPMLGQRGCRLGIVFPDIYRMQIEALFRAAAVCRSEGVTVIPEIMVPLVGHENELRLLRELVDKTAADILGAAAVNCPYRVGTMIEVPRAALTAGAIARHADFFSFGTNDLTQMTFGCSRDDAEGKFLSLYVDRKLLPSNPFEVLDADGVGQLIGLAVTSGRAVKPKLKTGICGEHGGDPESIALCERLGLDYVSCSPYRVPLARLAAAQAQLRVSAERASFDAAERQQEVS